MPVPFSLLLFQRFSTVVPRNTYANTTKDGDRKVVIPAEDVHDFAGRSHEARHNAHNAQGDCARNGGLLLRNSNSFADGLGQRENTLEHEVLVARKRAHGGHEPAVEEVRCANADEERSGRTSKRLALAKARSVSAPKSTKGTSSGVAPTEQENAHDANILGESVEHNPGTQKVEDDAIPAGVLALAHQSTEGLDVKAVERSIPVSEPVDRRDRNER
ncbi:hypothetical protein HG531_010909 [Fusarium graminearum]|nr:hypothetical protein HG531_010909 [Fusarium graminearum]